MFFLIFFPPFLQIYKVSTSCDLYEAFSIIEPVSTSTASRWHTLSSLYWTENSLLVIAVKGMEFKLCKLTGSSIVIVIKCQKEQISEKFLVESFRCARPANGRMILKVELLCIDTGITLNSSSGLWCYFYPDCIKGAF